MSDDALERLKSTDNKISESALGEIIDRYSSKLRRVVRRRLKTATDVDDCLSEVFGDLWQNRQTYHGENLSALLCVMARRRAVDYLRREYHRQTEPLEDVEYEASDGFSLEGDFEEKEARAELIAEIKRLGDVDAALVVGRYYLGLSGDELAAKYGMTRNAVDIRIHRAVKKLRKHFGTEEE